MAHDTNALDCLFGPYDFLDTAQPPPQLHQTHAPDAAFSLSPHTGALPSSTPPHQPNGAGSRGAPALSADAVGAAQPYRGVVQSRAYHAGPQEYQSSASGFPQYAASGGTGAALPVGRPGVNAHGGGRGVNGPQGQQSQGNQPQTRARDYALGGQASSLNGNAGVGQHSTSLGTSNTDADGLEPLPKRGRVGSGPNAVGGVQQQQSQGGQGGQQGGGPGSSQQPTGGQQGGGQQGQQNGVNTTGGQQGHPESELQDKADRCRARNREHARQTRRRKKEFVENLQTSVQQLGRENEVMAARLASLDRAAKDRDARAEAVAAVLALRVKREDDPEAHKTWAKYVEPDFELRLPHTPYRSFAAYEATASGRLVSGVAAAVADVKSLRVCLATLRRRLNAQRRRRAKAEKEREILASSGNNANAGDGPQQGNAATNNANKRKAPMTGSSSNSMRGGDHEVCDEDEDGFAPLESHRRHQPQLDPSSSGCSSSSSSFGHSSSSSDSDTQPTDGEAECVLERSGVAWCHDGAMMAPWTLRVTDARRHVILQQRGMLRATFRAAPAAFSSSSRGVPPETTRAALTTTRGGGSSSQSGQQHSDDEDDRQSSHDGHGAEDASATGCGRRASQQQPPADVAPAQRIATLELAFDTVSLWQQLQRGLRADRLYKTVPNTLDAALEPSDEARVVTSATRPFVIEHVNGAWTKLCGYDPDECLGKTLAILQGPETDQNAVAALTKDAEKGHATSAFLTNYDKDGHKFNNFVRVFPLVDDHDGSSKISHMLGVLQNVIG